MVTLEMRPDFTSSRNWEYSIGAWVAWRLLNWLNTVIRTSPMTSQMTRFLSILFKDLLLLCAAQHECHLTRVYVTLGRCRVVSMPDWPARRFRAIRRARRPA